MKRFSKFITSGQDEVEQQKRLPHLSPSQFESKLSDLLQKVSVQNRYTNRLSQCNMNNMQSLEKAKKQLERLAQIKKMEELNTDDKQELLKQMMIRLKSSQEELKDLFKEMVEARRQIKHLKREVGELQKTNIELQRQLMKIKRQKLIEVSVVRQEIEDSLLSSQMTQFLSISPNTHTLLYQFCLEAHKNKKLTNFFSELDRRIQATLDGFQKLKTNVSSNLDVHSRIKFKIPRNVRSEITKKSHRIKTEHIAREFNTESQ